MSILPMLKIIIQSIEFYSSLTIAGMMIFHTSFKKKSTKNTAWILILNEK